MAMERLKSCESVTALSEELGIHRTLLYKWREQMEAVESSWEHLRMLVGDLHSPPETLP